MSEAEMMMEWEEEQQGFHIYDDGGAAWRFAAHAGKSSFMS